MLVVNLFGAPCSGKSTLAAGLFYELKKRQIHCELVTEVAKESFLSDTPALLRDQLLVFAQQHHRLARLRDKVDLAVVDSPLPLSVLYQPPNYAPEFAALVRRLWSGFNNINFYLSRDHPYDPRLRGQTETEARLYDAKLKRLMSEWGILAEQLTAHDGLAARLAERLVRLLPQTDPPQYDLAS